VLKRQNLTFGNTKNYHKRQLNIYCNILKNSQIINYYLKYIEMCLECSNDFSEYKYDVDIILKLCKDIYGADILNSLNYLVCQITQNMIYDNINYKLWTEEQYDNVVDFKEYAEIFN